MSIMKIAKIKDSNSKEYRKLVSGIYSQFENLYKTMDLYAITESLSKFQRTSPEKPSHATSSHRLLPDKCYKQM